MSSPQAAPARAAAPPADRAAPRDRHRELRRSGRRRAAHVDAEPKVRPGDIPAGRLITTVALDGRITPGTGLVHTDTLDRAIASWRL